MTTESYIGSNVAAILDVLTPAMTTALGSPIECRLGTSEEARTGAPPRCTFVPPKTATRKYSGTVQQRPDLHIKAVHDVAPLFRVHLWGANYNQAEQLEIALQAALYTAFSGNGYELGDEGEQHGDDAATGAAQTFLFIVPVRFLRIPLPVIIYRPVTLDGSSAPGALTDAKGNNGIAGPDAGVAP